MRISRMKIENYRNLRSIDVTLGKIVTLIGENNSGKSNFLRTPVFMAGGELFD